MPLEFQSKISVNELGVVTALESNKGKAVVNLANKCNGTDTTEAAMFVNVQNKPLDLGEDTLAPLQLPSNSADVWIIKALANLEDVHVNYCGSNNPIEFISLSLVYNSTQMEIASDPTLQWRPHSDEEFAGTVSVVAHPNVPLSMLNHGQVALWYDQYATVSFTNFFLRNGFDGVSWQREHFASFGMYLKDGIEEGTIGLMMTINCNGAEHMLPSASTLFELPFTKSWNSVVFSHFSENQEAQRRRRLETVYMDRRRLDVNSVVHGDVNADGQTDSTDVLAILHHMLADSGSHAATSMTENQRLWLDANRDGHYANAGDLLYALRALSSATVYPVFTSECPYEFKQ